MLLGRARVRHDQALPAHVTRRLCAEFTLVTITQPRDWLSARRSLQLPPAPPDVDLSRGMIVGIQADVGEAASDVWPIGLRHVRTERGEGWVEASFAAGPYFPVLTAGYLELAYVPNLRTVRMVRISSGSGNRTFAIPAAAPARP